MYLCLLVKHNIFYQCVVCHITSLGRLPRTVLPSGVCLPLFVRFLAREGHGSSTRTSIRPYYLPAKDLTSTNPRNLVKTILLKPQTLKLHARSPKFDKHI